MPKKRHRSFMRSIVVAAALAVVIATVSTSGAGATIPGAAKPQTGGTWTIGVFQEVATMDTLKTVNQSPGLDRSILIFDSLMRIDYTTGQVVPGLAQSATTTDGSTWTLKLRPDLKFSDGTPLDADAVIFNFNYLKDPANAYTNIGFVSQITKMTALDSTTVEFKLALPNGSFNLVLTEPSGQMASPTAIKADPKGWGQKPIGAGPYLLKSWSRDREMVFTKNPNYFDKPKPYIDQIVFKIIDQSQLANALKTGVIDAIDNAAQAAQLQVAVDEPTKFRSGQIPKTSGSAGFGCNLDRAPCNDARFREAVSYAFDFNLAKQVLLAGFQYDAKSLQCAPFGPGHPYCDKSLKVTVNIAKGKKLIDEVKADGVKTDIIYTYNPASILGTAGGEFVQQQLAKIGVNVTLRGLSTPDYIAATNIRDYQTVVTYSPNVPPDISARFYNDFHSVGGPRGGRDILNLNNAQLDVALEKGRNSVKPTDQAEGYKEATKIMASQHLVSWFTPLFQVTVAKKTLVMKDMAQFNQSFLRYTDAWLKQGK